MVAKKISKLTQYKKKVVESFVKPKKAPEPEPEPLPVYDGLRCWICKEPVAPGQTAVCVKHQRTN